MSLERNISWAQGSSVITSLTSYFGLYFVTKKDVSEFLFFLTNTKKSFSFISFLFQKETWFFFFFLLHKHTKTTLRKAADECSNKMFFVWKCFIGSRDNDQIGGFLHTPWVTVPWCSKGCDTPNQLIPRHSTYEPTPLPSLAFYPAGFSPPSMRAKIISITYHIDYVTHVFKLAYILFSNQIWIGHPEC